MEEGWRIAFSDGNCQKPRRRSRPLSSSFDHMELNGRETSVDEQYVATGKPREIKETQHTHDFSGLD